MSTSALLVTVTVSSNKPVCGLSTGVPPRMANGATPTSVATMEAGAVPLLFVGFESYVVETADATLVNRPANGEFTVRVKLVLEPAASDLMFGQVTMPLVALPPDDADTNVSPCGRLSDATTLDAVDGPRFVTVMV